MPLDRHALSDACHLAEVQLRHAPALSLWNFCEDLTPGADNHGVPKRVSEALIIVVPNLTRSEHPRLILDGPSAQKDVPVSRARLLGEGGGDRQDLCSVVD